MTDPKKPDQNVSEDDWAAAMSEQESEEQPAAEDDPWAEAMAEQEAAESQSNADQGDSDPWAEALAEQQETEDAGDDLPADTASPPPAQAASERVFRPLDKDSGGGGARDLDMIMDIPVKLTVELGRTKLTIKQLLELTQGSVIELDGLAGEPMDILINGYLIAQGEVVVVDDKYGIRITEIITPSERVQKLNR